MRIKNWLGNVLDKSHKRNINQYYGCNLVCLLLGINVTIVSIIVYVLIKKRVKKKMKKINYKQIQFEQLSNRLPPLDFYNSYKITLEDWQLKVLQNIKHNKNVIVCVKTSMGKI